MEKFVPSMKKKYKGRLINREKQWPPRTSNKMIRLQLIHRVKGKGCSSNVQRGDEDKTVNQLPLAYEHLFRAERGKERVRKVLVEGDAGIGKTTLSISLSEDWACGKLFQDFELLILLSLRQREIASVNSLRELLKLLHSSQSVCESVASYLEEDEAENVLVIADGWDELGESEQREDSFLYQFLFKMFPLMSVVVTSRPSASAPLHNLPCIDRFVEVSGFNKDDIKEYIQSEFCSDKEKAHRLIEQLEYNPLIESVCSVPLSCAIVTHLWRTLEEALPSTMTQLYTKLIFYVVCRNLRKLEAYGPTFSMSSFDDLPEDLQHSWWLLCQFAFEAIEKDKIVFSKKELLKFFLGLAFEEKILCFGLLQSAETVLDVTCVVSFNFVHLTFMEYLAALYLTTQPHHRQLQFLEKCHSTMISRFFFGIYFANSKGVSQDFDVKKAIYSVASGNDYYVKNKLCHCAFEAQNNSVNDEVIQFLIDHAVVGVDFGDPCTAHDCTAVLYVINKMRECKNLCIDFSNCGISESHIRTLSDILASKHGELQVKRLDMNGNKLTDKCASDLFRRASNAFQSLLELNLRGNSIGSESMKLLAQLSSCGSRLSKLYLSNNQLGIKGVQILESAIRDGLLSKLQTFDLRGSLSDDPLINAAFIEALSPNCPQLKILNLYENNLGVPGATALARVMTKYQHLSAECGNTFKSRINFMRRQPQFLREVSLSHTNLGDKGLCAFIENLDFGFRIYELRLKGNNIHATGVSFLMESVSSGKIVINGLGLDLSDNPLGLEGTLAVSRMLCSNHCQAGKVCLSMCNLTTRDDSANNDSKGVGQKLCQMPQSNNIDFLILDGNSCTGEGIHILAGLMHLLEGPTILSSQNCGITSDDLKQLVDILSKLQTSSPSFCNKLESWILNNNEFDDTGVFAIKSHLASLFPCLGCKYGRVELDNNPVSHEMEKALQEELRRRKEVK